MRWSQPFTALLVGWVLSAAFARAVCVVDVPGCCAADVDCDDGSVCTGTETCDLGSGTCRAGTALACDAPVTCTVATCDPVSGCGTAPATGTTCDDGNPCTDQDQCTAGNCAGTPRSCAAIDACHTAGVCNPNTGECSAPEVSSGTFCNDGLFCNGIDICQSGVCTHGGNPCANGPECANTCDEDDDICAGAAGLPCGFDPDQPCSGGQCNGEGQCVPMPMPDVTCDDGDACTTADHCDAGQCTGVARSCLAPDDCHLDGVCNPDTGTCVNPTALDGTGCGTDGRLCTHDTCSGGVCQHVADDALCDDGTCSTGTCLPDDAGADARGCVAVPVHEGEVCTDDGIPCTQDVCQSGTCAHLPADDRCDPPTECGSTICVPERGDARGCAAPLGTQDGGTCSEDADPCSDDRCSLTTCTHTHVTIYETCAPVAGAWDRTRALARGVKTLRAGIRPASQVTDPLVVELLKTLDDIAATLDVAADTLAGRAPLEPPESAIETNGQQRARSAMVRLGKTPAAVNRILKLTGTARVRAALTAERTTLLKQDTKVLKRGLRQLLAELRKLRKISKSIAR